MAGMPSPINSKRMTPMHKGTNIDAQNYYTKVAQNIDRHRSEVGVFHNISQVTSAPGMTSRIASDS